MLHKQTDVQHIKYSVYKQTLYTEHCFILSFFYIHGNECIHIWQNRKKDKFVRSVWPVSGQCDTKLV